MSNTNNINFEQYIAELKSKYDINNKILLVHTPEFLLNSFNVDIVKNKGYYAYPPTGLQWISKVLSVRDLQVEILDLNYLLLKNVINDEKSCLFHYPKNGS